MKRPKFKIGDKLKFFGMKRAIPVMAMNDIFTICAYRLTGCLAEYELLYTIVDWKNEKRGPDVYAGWGLRFNYLDTKDAARALIALGDGKMHKKLCKKRGRFYRKMVWHCPELEMSRRRSMKLDFEKVIAS